MIITMDCGGRKSYFNGPWEKILMRVYQLYSQISTQVVAKV